MRSQTNGQAAGQTARQNASWRTIRSGEGPCFLSLSFSLFLTLEFLCLTRSLNVLIFFLSLLHHLPLSADLLPPIEDFLFLSFLRSFVPSSIPRSSVSVHCLFPSRFMICRPCIERCPPGSQIERRIQIKLHKVGEYT